MASLAIACGPVERDLGDTYSDDLRQTSPSGPSFGDGVFTSSDATVSAARIAGDMGPMRQIDESASPNVYSEPGYADMDLTAQNSRGAAMQVLWIQGGFDHPAFTAGTTQTFMLGDYGSGNDLHIEVTNCASNSSVGEWDYDVPADEVTVEISETDNADELRVDYTSVSNDYDYGEEVSSGSFIVAR